MRMSLNPYIAFRGEARAAMEFYRDVLGGELELFSAAGFAHPDVATGPGAGAIAHAQLRLPDGSELMAWDVPAEIAIEHGSTVALYLGGDEEGLRRIFAALSVDGTVTLPMDRQPWGDVAGSVIDRFGISWMLNVPATGS